MPDRRRHDVPVARAAAGLAIALGLAALVAALLLARPPSVALAGAGPSQAALDDLGKARESLAKAEINADRFDGRFEERLDDARVQKVFFIRDAFGATSLLGRCAGDILIHRLDRIDLKLEEALQTSGKLRAASLDEALAVARNLDDFLDPCASGGTPILVSRIKASIQVSVQRDAAGKLDRKELDKQAAKVLERKLALLEGETIEGCEVTELFVLIERIDRLIIRARETMPNDFEDDGKRKATRERRDLAETANRLVRQLTRTYMLIPCDPTEDAPPGGGGEPPPPGSTPPPPGSPPGSPPPPPPDDDDGDQSKCADGEDNDGDGLADDADPGCQTAPQAAYDPDDVGEDHVDATDAVDCPTLPASPDTREVQIVQNNVGTSMVRHLLRNLTSDTVLVEKAMGDPDFASGGMGLGPLVCGPGTFAQVDWQVSGTTVTYDLDLTRMTTATPTPHQIVAAASTR